MGNGLRVDIAWVNGCGMERTGNDMNNTGKRKENPTQ